MNKTIYVIRNDKHSRSCGNGKVYLRDYELAGTAFTGSWTSDLSKAMEFTKDKAVSLAAQLNTDWNGRHHRALQKCRLAAENSKKINGSGFTS